MNILAINTSQNIGQISLITASNNLSLTLSETKGFSESILVSINSILSQGNISVNDLDAISVVVGPGSYTGTRIGISLAKGIVCGNEKIKICSVNLFELLSENVNDKGNFIIAENSMVGDYYYAIFNEKRNIVLINSMPIQDILSFAKSNGYNCYYDLIKDDTALIKITNKKCINNEFTDMVNLKPYYVKLPQAQKELKQKFSTQLSVRKMTIEDICEVEKIEESSFERTMYSISQFKDEVLNHNYFVAVYKGNIIGYAGFSACENEAELLKIACLPTFRRMGVGKKLIEYYEQNFNKEKIFLEVEKTNNNAIVFYKTMGFCVCGERKKYYNNTIDAILMCKTK